ncbi:helix-turn-helix domain-containing protein [Methylobacterium fujisawaense]
MKLSSIPIIISAEQCRAARAWLDWKQEDLAQRADVSLSTVRDFEKGRRMPFANNLKAMVGAFQAGGIRPTFKDSGEPTGITRIED